MVLLANNNNIMIIMKKRSRRLIWNGTHLPLELDTPSSFFFLILLPVVVVIGHKENVSMLLLYTKDSQHNSMGLSGERYSIDIVVDVKMDDPRAKVVVIRREPTS